MNNEIKVLQCSDYNTTSLESTLRQFFSRFTLLLPVVGTLCCNSQQSWDIFCRETGFML